MALKMAKHSKGKEPRNLQDDSVVQERTGTPLQLLIEMSCRLVHTQDFLKIHSVYSLRYSP